MIGLFVDKGFHSLYLDLNLEIIISYFCIVNHSSWIKSSVTFGWFNKKTTTTHIILHVHMLLDFLMITPISSGFGKKNKNIS